jgi:capsular polysaccharide biosynthesis protein
MNERERQLPPLPVVLRRVLPVALAVAIVCAAVAGFLSAQREDRYETSALLLLRPVAPDPAVSPGAEAAFTEGEGLATNVLLVSRPGVLGRVAERPEIELTPAQIGQGLEVEGEEGTNIIRVTATMGDPLEAAEVATAVAEEFVQIRRTASATRVRQVQELLEDQLAALSEGEGEGSPREARLLLREEIERLTVREEAPGQQPQVVQEASVPAAPVSPQPRRDAGLAGLLGLALGAGLGLLRVGSDRRLEGVDEMREALAAPVLVTVPSWSTLRRGRGRGKLPRRGAQGFRLLHLSLRQREGHGPVRTVAITAAGPDADAGVAAWHLAAAAAAARDSVILVEEGASVDGGGLAERVRQASFDGGQGSRSFDILPTDESHPGGEDDAGRPARLDEVLHEARDDYDVVVVPTPSMVDTPDAALIMEHADGVVVTARRGRLERDRVDALRTQLELLGTPVLAVVVDGE